jgi:hypothetical protein
MLMDKGIVFLVMLSERLMFGDVNSLTAKCVLGGEKLVAMYSIST